MAFRLSANLIDRPPNELRTMEKLAGKHIVESGTHSVVWEFRSFNPAVRAFAALNEAGYSPRLSKE